MVTQHASGMVDSSPCPTAPSPRRGRPVNPASLRQTQPWIIADVSRATFYRCWAVWVAAGMGKDDLIHPLTVVNDAPNLVAMAKHNGITTAEVLTYWRTQLDYDPAKRPLGRYLSKRMLRRMDRAKRARTRGTLADRLTALEGEGSDPRVLGPIVCIEKGQVVGYR